jgi:hypothetical protein
VHGACLYTCHGCSDVICKKDRHHGNKQANYLWVGTTISRNWLCKKKVARASVSAAIKQCDLESVVKI